jgi:hypothetical protein
MMLIITNNPTIPLRKSGHVRAGVSEKNPKALDFATGCPQFGHAAACVETSFPHAEHFFSGIARLPLILFGFES